MNCIVCGKPVTIKGANTCSTRCLLSEKKSDDDTKSGRPAASADGMAAKLFRAQFMPPRKEREVPMLKVAHPWIKNKNIVEGETVFSFDGEGIAQVKDIANARVDRERLLKKPTGKFFIPDEEKEEATPPPKKAEPAPAKKAAAVPESEPVTEPEPEPEEEAEEEPATEKATKKTPRKKGKK